jgi:hypothetical protein
LVRIVDERIKQLPIVHSAVNEWLRVSKRNLLRRAEASIGIEYIWTEIEGLLSWHSRKVECDAISSEYNSSDVSARLRRAPPQTSVMSATVQAGTASMVVAPHLFRIESWQRRPNEKYDGLGKVPGAATPPHCATAELTARLAVERLAIQKT